MVNWVRPEQLRGRGEKGHSLLLAMVVLVLVTTAALLVSSALMLRMREVQEEMIAVRLTALVDAAMAETLAQFSRGGRLRGGERPFGGGRISSEVIATQGRSRTVRIEAHYGAKVRRLEVEVLLTPQGPTILSWRRLAA